MKENLISIGIKAKRAFKIKIDNKTKNKHDSARRIARIFGEDYKKFLSKSNRETLTQ